MAPKLDSKTEGAASLSAVYIAGYLFKIRDLADDCFETLFMGNLLMHNVHNWLRWHVARLMDQCCYKHEKYKAHKYFSKLCIFNCSEILYFLSSTFLWGNLPMMPKNVVYVSRSLGFVNGS